MTGGHGHVRPRPDGGKARCGGPGICGECALELVASVTGVDALPRECGGVREHGRRAGVMAAFRAPYAAGSAEWRAYLTSYVAGLLEEAFRDRRPSAAPARFGSFADG